MRNVLKFFCFSVFSICSASFCSLQPQRGNVYNVHQAWLGHRCRLGSWRWWLGGGWMAVRERAPIGGRAVGRHNKKPLAVARLELDVGRAPPQTEPSVATRLEVESGAAQSAHCVHSAHCAYSSN